MRIIAGALKGRRLTPVPGYKTRPTADRVKEALFNIIPNTVYRNGSGLDLFAGTGSLGIEALSRGCGNMLFVDCEAKAVKTLHKNIKALNLEAYSEVYRQEALRAVRQLARRNEAFHLILLDPPYGWNGLERLLQLIADEELLRPEGMLSVETSRIMTLSNQYGSISLTKHHRYGDTMLWLYTREEI